METPSVITIPNQFLKQPTKKVEEFGNGLKQQIQEMLKVLRTQKGIGLAANQIGYDNNVILVEFEDPKGKEHIPFTVVINPEIIKTSEEKECFEEGCLSVPQIELDVERAAKIKIKYQNEKGKIVKAAPKGLFARILQHEVDHLNGIIFTERVKEQFFAQNPELKNLKILFCGSGEFGAVVLKGLILMGFDVTIVTEKAKPAGREQLTKLTPVAQVAGKFGKHFVEVEESPVPFKDTGPTIPQREIGAYALGLASASRHHAARPARVTLKALGSSSSNWNLLLCCDFGQKIPSSMLKNAFNIHPSLLPKYRGPSPIQTAILNGEKETGASIIKMTEKIDAGPVLAQIAIEIEPNDDYLTLRNRLATAGLKALIKTLPDIVADKLQEVLQDEEKVIMTHKFSKADGEIDWKKPAEKIERQIRALYPWPGTFTTIDNKRLIIHKAHIDDNKLVLDIVQLEGKKPMKFSDFLRGYKGPKPVWLNGSHV